MPDPETGRAVTGLCQVKIGATYQFLRQAGWLHFQRLGFAGNWYVALFFVVAATAANAQMYKWVDEKGVTHYSAEPPPEGAKGAGKVELKVTPAAPGAARDDWKAKDQRARAEKAKQDIAGQREQGRSDAQRRQRCQHAAEQLDTLRSQRPVYQFDAKGQKSYVEDKDRPAEIARWQAEVDKHCER